MMRCKHNFSVSVEVNRLTGEVIAAYFTIRKGKVNETREFAEGRAFADYDSRGRLLGLELLGPCDVAVLEKIPGRDVIAKRFLRTAAPREMVLS
jgi:uncharacterized protein YuzE